LIELERGREGERERGREGERERGREGERERGREGFPSRFLKPTEPVLLSSYNVNVTEFCDRVKWIF
jgi:hypothetical protein